MTLTQATRRPVKSLRLAGFGQSTLLSWLNNIYQHIKYEVLEQHKLNNPLLELRVASKSTVFQLLLLKSLKVKQPSAQPGCSYRESSTPTPVFPLVAQAINNRHVQLVFKPFVRQRIIFIFPLLCYYLHGANAPDPQDLACGNHRRVYPCW